MGFYYGSVWSNLTASPGKKGDFKQLQFITVRLCEKLLWKIFDRTQWPLLARMMT
jgi:hypothetical protein